MELGFLIPSAIFIFIFKLKNPQFWKSVIGFISQNWNWQFLLAKTCTHPTLVNLHGKNSPQIGESSKLQYDYIYIFIIYYLLNIFIHLYKDRCLFVCLFCLLGCDYAITLSNHEGPSLLLVLPKSPQWQDVHVCLLLFHCFQTAFRPMEPKKLLNLEWSLFLEFK
jgi:hypothetical protein